MSMWKLPRKRKKAFIARYGVGAYKALRYLSATRRDELLSVRYDSGRTIDIAVDFGASKPVAVLSQTTEGGLLHVLAQVNLGTGARAKRKTMEDYRAGTFEDGSPLYLVPRHWLNIPTGPPAPGLPEFLEQWSRTRNLITDRHGPDASGPRETLGTG